MRSPTRWWLARWRSPRSTQATSGGCSTTWRASSASRGAGSPTASITAWSPASRPRSANGSCRCGRARSGKRRAFRASHRPRSPSSPSGAIAPQRPAAPWRSPTSCESYPKCRSTDLDRRDPDRPSWTYHDRRRGSRSSTVGGRSPDSRQPGWLRRLSRQRQALARGERPRKEMRLASKIFLTSAVVVVVLAIVGVLSLRAVGRLASVNREITTRTVPALRLAASTRDVMPTMVRLEARTWSGVLLALTAAVSLALLGSGLIAHRLTLSLGTLSAATAEVAAGHFDRPITVESRDEIGELARSFNAMALELRRLEGTKEEVFASVSHELRSPLTSIREGAHLLRERVSGPLTARQQRLVEIIAAGSDRLLGLVNQILEVTRLRAGVLPIQRSRLELDTVVARAVDELRPRADQAGIVLEREQSGEEFTCLGDEDRLLQVIVNLVANAIRFTPRGGRVVARVIATSAELEIQVEDTGVGIPASELAHIFEPYRQAHSHRGGTGLGLAIVRGVAQAHGGRVTVESQEGKGSRFTVLLPRT